MISFSEDFEREIEELEDEKLRLLCDLIRKNILDIKIAVTNQCGIYHDKLGILQDFENNKLVFYGSPNSSYGGYRSNYEKIRISKGWEAGSKEIVEEEIREFDSLWQNTNEFVEVYEYQKTAEKKLLDIIDKRTNKNKQNEIVLRDYQEQAIQAWIDNNYRGFFVMATGTGKTWTAIFAAKKLVKKESALIVICAPYKHLVKQWSEDVITAFPTADNECPMMVEKNLPSCGKSRFGCWVCTMVEKDKSMEAMIANDDEKAWMTPLLEFRNRFGDEEHDRERRSFKKMQGYLQGSYGKLHHGPYKKEIREQWLRELLEIQVEINNNGPDEFANLELITKEELRNIRRIWVYDKHEFDDSLPRIYKSVMNKEFEDPEWIGSEAYGHTEWDILRKTCSDMFPEEELSFELLYSLIDTENQANSVNQRKGILDSLEKCIKHNFYRDESDATQYYTQQLERKKDLGGRYNEKFFAHIQDEGEEFDDVPDEE